MKRIIKVKGVEVQVEPELCETMGMSLRQPFGGYYLHDDSGEHIREKETGNGYAPCVWFKTYKALESFALVLSNKAKRIK